MLPAPMKATFMLIGCHATEKVTCRTISRFLCPCRRQPFLWASHYWPALATYPRVKRSGPLLLPYLVLLRVGFALPAGLLRPRCALTAPFHPYPRRGGMFSVALSVENGLTGPSRPLAGTLPCGDRTFLPAKRGGYPSGKLRLHYRSYEHGWAGSAETAHGV